MLVTVTSGIRRLNIAGVCFLKSVKKGAWGKNHEVQGPKNQHTPIHINVLGCVESVFSEHTLLILLRRTLACCFLLAGLLDDDCWTKKPTRAWGCKDEEAIGFMGYNYVVILTCGCLWNGCNDEIRLRPAERTLRFRESVVSIIYK